MPWRADDESSGIGGGDRFVTTHWSLVVAAGRGETAPSRDALAALCRAYWYPLYAFIRRRGFGPADAQDLTQEFFARLLEKNYVQAADRERGRFRSFLLAAVKHFLANERDRANARKRGGGQPLLSLDLDGAESRYCLEPADAATPERLFERRWAVTLLDRVLERLREEYAAKGQAAVFEQLKPFLAREKGAAPYRELAERAGLTEGSIKTAVHRLRRRYRSLLEDEIAQTVCAQGDVANEVRELFAALRGGAS
jgi:RNA polymerase sigma factor (sigma-70 family)